MKGTVEETRVMIEGKLLDMGRDPRNVQVILTKDSQGRDTISLHDVNGEFVDTGLVQAPEGDGSVQDSAATPGGRPSDQLETMSPAPSDSETHGMGEVEQLKEQNTELIACTAELRRKVSDLEGEVATLKNTLRETEHVGEMWKLNCAQVFS